MEYYTVIRQNERMPSAATLMGLEIILLSEVNHKEKDKYHMISLMWTLKCVSRSVLSDSLDPMDCSLPGSSVHGLLQARILEYTVLPSLV